jgi:hypothetical protein
MASTVRAVRRGYAQIVAPGKPPLEVFRDADGWWEVAVRRGDQWMAGELGALHRRRRDAISEALALLERGDSYAVATDEAGPLAGLPLDVMNADVVGEREIAGRLGVQSNTVHIWRKRGLLPPADWTVSGGPAWSWATIEKWARTTGRLGGDVPS